MIIGLFGLPGSGKTTIRKEFSKKYSSFYCISASEILKNANKPILNNSLDTIALDNNQAFLVSKIKELRLQYRNIFIELHAIIEDKNGDSYLVNEWILKNLNLDKIYVIDIPPSQIFNQCRSDTKKHRFFSFEKISKEQIRQKQYLKKVFGNRAHFIKNFNDLQSEFNSI